MVCVLIEDSCPEVPTETIKSTLVGLLQFICVISHYLEWEIAGADIHKRLTVMRVHVNQAVVCKDKTKDKLFKNIRLFKKWASLPFLCRAAQSHSLALLARIKYASQKVVAF